MNLFNTVPGMEGGGAIRVCGLKQGAGSLIFDGSVHNESWHGYDSQMPPDADAIQEFRVETDNPTAKNVQLGLKTPFEQLQKPSALATQAVGWMVCMVWRSVTGASECTS